MNPYPAKWACGVCHRIYAERAKAEKCCTRGHEDGWDL